MKSKLLIPCLAILLFMSVSAKAQNTFSMVYYDSTDHVYGYSLARTYDNGYLVSGNIFSNGLLFKIDSAGALLWSKEFDFGGTFTFFKRIIPTNDSCFVICGSVNYDLLCVKVTSGGDTVWSRKYSGLNSMQAFSVTQTFDNGYLLTGTAGNSTAPYLKSLLLKLDSSGNYEWDKVLTTGSAANYAYDVKQAPDSDLVFIGYKESGLIGSAYIFKMSPTGILRWSWAYSDSTNPVLGASMLIVPNGIVCLIEKGFDFELMKMDLAGNIEFQKSYSDVSEGVCGGCFQSRFQSTADLGFIIITGTDPAIWGGFRNNLIKIDSLGDFQWMRNIEMSLADICENADNGFTLAGNGPLFGVRGMSTTFNRQIGIIRTDSIGYHSTCIASDSIPVTSDSLIVSVFTFTDTSFGNTSNVFPTITTVTLVSESGCVAFVGGLEEINAENFIRINPNPASSRITFSFAKSARQFNLTICNVMGQEVYSKLLTGQETHDFSLDNTFPPGMYIAVLRDDRFVYSKKLLIE